MNKKSEVDILIEQCIQDANREYLEEGFVDNIKAGLNGAKEWLKADARNSFKLGKKNDIKNDRRWSARKGKVASYAKSIANTMQDFKKQGGTLGRGMKVDDVISRLNQVAQGKYPRGNGQTTQPSQKPLQNSVKTQTVKSAPQSSAPQPAPQKGTANSQDSPRTQPAKPVQQPVEEKQPIPPSDAPKSYGVTNNTVGSSNTDAQTIMLNSIGKPESKEVQAPPTTDNTTGEKKPKVKTSGLIRKAGKALSSGAKKIGKGLASKSRKVKDAMVSGYKGLKDKMAAAKKRKRSQPVTPEIIEPEIMDSATPSSALDNSNPESKKIEPFGLPSSTEDTNLETKRPLSPRERRHKRDHALGKERRADKIERQIRNNKKSAAKSRQVQGTNKKPKFRPEAEEVVKEHYITEAQLSMLNSIR